MIKSVERAFRIVGNDNLFVIVNGRAYYLEDYDPTSVWREDSTVISKLKTGEYTVEN